VCEHIVQAFFLDELIGYDHSMTESKRRTSIWFVRLAVSTVLVINLSAALAYLVMPERFVSGYELEGEVGRVVVQGFGILFLMWNVTYPPVIVNPVRARNLFIVVLLQQAIALVGESLLLISVPIGYAALIRTGMRFIVFDGAGLLLMTVGFLLIQPVWRADSTGSSVSNASH
jgi:hypothetical protein